MRRSTLPEAAQELMERFELDVAPFDHDVVMMEELIEALSPRVASRTKNLNGVVTNFLKNELQAFRIDRMPVDLGSGPRRVNLWVIRNQDDWATLSKGEASLRYQAMMEKDFEKMPEDQD